MVLENNSQVECLLNSFCWLGWNHSHWLSWVQTGFSGCFLYARHWTRWVTSSPFNPHNNNQGDTTGIPCFNVPCLIELHRCCVFYKWKARLSTCKKITTGFIGQKDYNWLYWGHLELNLQYISYACIMHNLKYVFFKVFQDLEQNEVMEIRTWSQVCLTPSQSTYTWLLLQDLIFTAAVHLYVFWMKTWGLTPSLVSWQQDQDWNPNLDSQTPAVSQGDNWPNL